MFKTRLRANKSHVQHMMSRREVQRRFAPGTMFVYAGNKIGTVIGWAPVAGRSPKDASSWEVLMLVGDSRLERQNWMSVRGWSTLEEWENDAFGLREMR